MGKNRMKYKEENKDSYCYSFGVFHSVFCLGLYIFFAVMIANM